jgi:hypothetical protein
VDAPTPAPLGRRQILIAFSGLVLAMLLAALDSTIVSTALPTIVSELAEWDPVTGANVSDYLRNAVKDLIPDARRAS